MLRIQVFPLPKIQDVLHRRPGYKFFTKIDLSMCYYTFELDEASRNLCVIVMPFGKYCYKCLPMGVSKLVICARKSWKVYSSTWTMWKCSMMTSGFSLTICHSHAKDSQSAGSIARQWLYSQPLKCKWVVQETDCWLGYWLTPTGLKPWSKKIQAIQQLEHPRNVKQLRSFIGAVNYYRDLWPRCAHYLTNITTLTRKGKFVWTEKHQKAFEQMKALLAVDCLLRYPDHNLPFHIYTDASDYQMGTVIMQANQPVARKSTQRNIIARQSRRNCCLSWKFSASFVLCCTVLIFLFIMTTKISLIPTSTHSESFGRAFLSKNMAQPMNMSKKKQ